MRVLHALGIAMLLSGCARVSSGGPIPNPSASPSAPPSSCNALQPTTTAIIGMGSSFTAVVDPTYGAVNGYAEGSTQLLFPNTASPISLHSGDLVQFVNTESGSPAAVYHSAALIVKASSFPPVPYTFPAADASPAGNAINAQAWSTGRIPPIQPLGYCFSQQFTAQSGTYYFGDVDYYNTANMRDVIVVK